MEVSLILRKFLCMNPRIHPWNGGSVNASGSGRLGISARSLALGFTAVLLLTCVIGALGISSLQTMSDLTTNLYDHPFTVTTSLLDSRGEMRVLQRELRDAVIPGDETKIDAHEANLDVAWQRAAATLAVARAGFLGDKKGFDAVEQGYAAYPEFVSGNAEPAAAGQSLEAAIAVIRTTGAEKTKAITQAMTPLIQFSTEKAAAFMRNAEATRASVTRLNIMLLIAAVVIAAGVSTFAARSITRPVGCRLRTSMASLAAGEKTIEVPGLDRGDEIGAMAQAVDVFRRNALEMDRLRAEQEESKNRGANRAARGVAAARRWVRATGRRCHPVGRHGDDPVAKRVEAHGRQRGAHQHRSDLRRERIRRGRRQRPGGGQRVGGVDRLHQRDRQTGRECPGHRHACRRRGGRDHRAGAEIVVNRACDRRDRRVDQ